VAILSWPQYVFHTLDSNRWVQQISGDTPSPIGVLRFKLIATVDMEARMVPFEHLLHRSLPDTSGIKQTPKNLVAEQICQFIEVNSNGQIVKTAIRSENALSDEHMDVGVVVCSLVPVRLNGHDGTGDGHGHGAPHSVVLLESRNKEGSQGHPSSAA